VTHISKSDYLKYRVHPAYLWYQKHRRKALPPVDDNLQYVFDQGKIFEDIAMQLVDEPVVIQGEHYQFDKLIAATEQALASGATTFAQPAFMTDERLFCRPDLLEKIDGSGWRLTEIKSSTSFKQYHQYDLAFQRQVLTTLGFNVSKVQLLHVNRDYVRDGAVNPERLVASRDVTEEVVGLEDEVARDIAEAQSVVEQAEVDDHPAFAGNLNQWMDIYRYLHPELPDDSVLNMIQLKPQLVREAYHSGIESITELGTAQLTDKQTTQVMAWRNDKIHIEPDDIRDFLQGFTYPLYFLDYETSAHVVPLYSGVKPYQQLPFQYSLHRLASPDAELEHFEYLHRDGSLPIEPLMDKLLSEIGDSGTVLAWFHKFEMYCNRTMGKLSPDYNEAMTALNKRMVDLRVPFARLDYVDKRFQGSSSLKNVLPVMCPELSYDELGIHEGGAAQRLWQQVQDGSRADEADQIYADLLEYCKLDTYAMVAIYRKLRLAAGIDKELVQGSLL